TNFLGIPGQADHPRYLEAVRRVLDAVKRNGKTAGFMTTEAAQGRALLAQGFRMLAFSGDIWIYQRGLCDRLAALRTEFKQECRHAESSYHRQQAEQHPQDTVSRRPGTRQTGPTGAHPRCPRACIAGHRKGRRAGLNGGIRVDGTWVEVRMVL